MSGCGHFVNVLLRLKSCVSVSFFKHSIEYKVIGNFFCYTMRLYYCLYCITEEDSGVKTPYIQLSIYVMFKALH